jgi:hypothetical protein
VRSASSTVSPQSSWSGEAWCAGRLNIHAAGARPPRLVSFPAASLAPLSPGTARRPAPSIAGRWAQWLPGGTSPSYRRRTPADRHRALPVGGTDTDTGELRAYVLKVERQSIKRGRRPVFRRICRRRHLCKCQPSKAPISAAFFTLGVVWSGSLPPLFRSVGQAFTGLRTASVGWAKSAFRCVVSLRPTVARHSRGHVRSLWMSEDKRTWHARRRRRRD